MVWTSTDARDIPPDSNKLVCHNSRECKIVICLLCDGGWCRSDFNVKVKKGEGFYVSNNIIVCPAHGHITYNLLDAAQTSDSAEISILNKKLLLLTKHIESAVNGALSRDVDMDNDAVSVVSETCSVASAPSGVKRRRGDDGIDSADDCPNCTLVIQENLYLKEMNSELKQHNSELREHNNYLIANEQ